MKQILLSCVILFFVLVSCTPHNSAIMVDTQCDPPCWQDINPGVTTKEQALQIIPNTLGYKADSISEARKNSRNFPQQVCWGFQENGNACALIRDNTVQVLDFLTNEATIEEAFEKFGDPDHLYLGAASGDAFCTYTEMIYSEKGVSLFITGNSWLFFCKKSLTSRSSINSITYFDPAVYELLLDEGFFGNPEQKDFGLLKWTGLESLNNLLREANE